MYFNVQVSASVVAGIQILPDQAPSLHGCSAAGAEWQQHPASVWDIPGICPTANSSGSLYGAANWSHQHDPRLVHGRDAVWVCVCCCVLCVCVDGMCVCVDICIVCVCGYLYCGRGCVCASLMRVMCKYTCMYHLCLRPQLCCVSLCVWAHVWSV